MFTGHSYVFSLIFNILKGYMKTDQKKRLVLIGIRRKGDSEFKLKTERKEPESLKSEFSIHSSTQVETVSLCA